MNWLCPLHEAKQNFTAWKIEIFEQLNCMNCINNKNSNCMLLGSKVIFFSRNTCFAVQL